MEAVSKNEIMKAVYAAYLRGRGYKKTTVQDILRNLMTLWRGTGKGADMTKQDLENYIYKKERARATRNSYRSIGMAYIKFKEWWESKGIEEFGNWLRRQGYSEATVRDYKYVLLCVQGKFNATRSNAEKLDAAIKQCRIFFQSLF